MYKGASDLSQSRHGRQVVVDAMVAGGRHETQSAPDRLRNTQRAAHALNMQLQAVPKNAPDRPSLIERKLQLEADIRRLKVEAHRAVNRDPAVIRRHFLDICKERMAPALFKIYLDEAMGRFKATQVADEASALSTDPDIAA